MSDKAQNAQPNAPPMPTAPMVVDSTFSRPIVYGRTRDAGLLGDGTLGLWVGEPNARAWFRAKDVRASAARAGLARFVPIALAYAAQAFGSPADKPPTLRLARGSDFPLVMVRSGKGGLLGVWVEARDPRTGNTKQVRGGFLTPIETAAFEGAWKGVIEPFSNLRTAALMASPLPEDATPPANPPPIEEPSAETPSAEKKGKKAKKAD